MTLSESRRAYRDCEDAFEQALEKPKGIRLWFEGPDGRGKARHFRLRMNNLRKIERNANRRTYKPDDPAYGTTPWDTLVIRDRAPSEADADGGGWWLYIEPNTAIPAEVEEIE